MIHSVCPPNFAQVIVFNCSWEDCKFSRACENNLCKIWRANGVYYRGFENREYSRVHALRLSTATLKNLKNDKNSARASPFLIQFHRSPLHDYRVQLPNTWRTWTHHNKSGGGGGGGVVKPIMADKRRLCPKGVTFLGFRYIYLDLWKQG